MSDNRYHYRMIGLCLRSALDNFKSGPAPLSDMVLSDIEVDLEAAIQCIRKIRGEK